MSDHLIILGRQGKPQVIMHAGKASVNDPFAGGRQIAFSDPSGFSAGMVSLEVAVPVEALGHAEMLVIVSGAVDVGGDQYVAGDALVLPRGYSGMITSRTNARWFFNAMSTGESDAKPAAIRLQPNLARAPSPGPAPEVLIGPKPDTHALNLFTDSSGMRAGVWDVMSPCERGIVHHRVHELMHLIEGEVSLTHRDGERQIFHAGDTIFVPRGAPYAWKNDTQIIKYYAVM